MSPQHLEPDGPQIPRPGVSFGARIVAAGLVVVVAAAVFVASLLWLEADETAGIIDDGPIARTGDSISTASAGRPQTILLVGDDHRFKTDDGAPTPKGEPTRSDTMILVRLDPEANATTILSLPRDLLISQPGQTGGQKLNASYANGPEGLIKTLKRLLGTPEEPFKINRYVSIRFTAFSKAVNSFGCFYTDIDRRYFNDNNPPVGGGGRYAEIDIDAGYQRLCGEDALGFVRFRHLDNSIVRDARQANFLAEARGQLAGSKLFKDRNKLLREIRSEIETNKMSATDLLRILRLIVSITDKPTKRVALEVGFTPAGDVTATPEALQAAADAFLHPKQVPGAATREAKEAKKSGGASSKRKPRAKRKKAGAPSSLTADPGAARQVVARDIVSGLDALPILYPKLRSKQATYPEGNSRAYDIASANEARYVTYPWQAYRIVARLGAAANGQYYGVQGTTWRDPPVLDLADDEESLGGRKFLVQYDGKQIRRMMLRTGKGTYWVSNSLNDRLTNAEMRAIAKSLTTYR